ncbi:MAG: protein tyrosine kinase modulator [Carnobacterium sp.]|uniref:YveK family protein n=1 Tax=Carnobacterium sp. TaxID=48221 RepID=UPI002647A1E0|nr:Wzz/FepE/Etk N-terminal domain-containing protein [Carnobacterium sp.]MDN5372931.1 protein tyrosine kinase modulator [Carnobacterium sp.]
MEEEYDISELLNVLKKNIVMIISLGLIGLILSSVYTLFIVTPQYSASTQLLVNEKNNDGSSIEATDITKNLQMISTYTELIKGPAILNGVQENLESNLTTNQLADKISITSPEGALVFLVTVTDSDPYKAAEMANAVAETFQSEIGTIMNSVDNVAIAYKAVPNVNPISPNIPLNLILGLLVGGMLGIGISFLREFMDKTIKDSATVYELSKWNNLGEIHEITEEDLIVKGRSHAIQRQNKKSRV